MKQRNSFDNIIKKLLWDDTKQVGNSNYRRYIQKRNSYPNITEYLTNRYVDSLSITETIQRIVYNIEERPVCEKCGNPVKFIGKPNSKGIFKRFCSNSCANSINSAKASQTKIEKYGDAGCTIKGKETKLKQYGNANYNGDRAAAVLKTDYIKRNEKSNQTKLDRYGYVNYNGDRSAAVAKIDYNEVRRKGKQTCIKRYGDPYYHGDRKAAMAKVNWEQSIKRNKETKLKRYGDPNYNNMKKSKQTCLEKYGVEYNILTDACKAKLADPLTRKKILETKRKRGTFNTSKPEEYYYSYLVSKYGEDNIIRQYHDERYPFNCDFYIKTDDLFIELQGNWTHGTKPYEDTDSDNEILNDWIEEAKTKPYYKNAIYTWTDLDVRKRNIAKKNKLNYIEIWGSKSIIKKYEK